MQRSSKVIRNEIAMKLAFEPDADLPLLALQLELDRAKQREREQAAARKAVRDGIATATHVRLADGWVEVIAYAPSERTVIVANGANDPHAIAVRHVLEVRTYGHG